MASCQPRAAAGDPAQPRPNMERRSDQRNEKPGSCSHRSFLLHELDAHWTGLQAPFCPEALPPCNPAVYVLRSGR
jgi:hypothetical protein